MKDQARLMGDNSWREGKDADLDGTKEKKKKLKYILFNVGSLW
jgi:hypothetical protein